MVGRRAEKAHSRRVGKNWVMMGFWKKRVVVNRYTPAQDLDMSHCCYFRGTHLHLCHYTDFLSTAGLCKATRLRTQQAEIEEKAKFSKLAFHSCHHFNLRSSILPTHSLYTGAEQCQVMLTSNYRSQQSTNDWDSLPACTKGLFIYLF